MRASFEKVIPPQDASFNCVYLDLPRFEAPWHFHPECELILVVSGEGQRLIGDHTASFRPGDLVLIGAGLPHWYCTDPRVVGRQRSTAIIRWVKS